MGHSHITTTERYLHARSRTSARTIRCRAVSGFIARTFIDIGQWLRVVVDFNDVPAWIVTAFVQERDPRLKQR